jgi:hypothetical protein
MGPIFTDGNDFAVFELARLGYDVKSGKETFPSAEDADDLLFLTLGDPVEPATFAGMVWAIKNRPVNWKLHLSPGEYSRPEQQADLHRLLDAAGMSHLLKVST